MKKDNTWFEYLQNPRAIALKKFMVELLYTEYYTYEDLLSRLGASLVTDGDIHKFAGMINEIYHKGYKKAVDDYKDKLNQMGIKVNVTTTEQNLADNQ